MLAAGLASLALAASLAAPPSAEVLLARHSPVTVLAAGEPYAPSAVAPFLAAAAEADDQLDVTACDPKLGPDAAGCYAPLVTAPRAYGRAVRVGTRTVLQYWLFYPYNDWSVPTRAAGPIWRSHEGDWESVTIVLDRRLRPVEAGYSAHCGGSTRPWARVRKRGTHPFVYVARGSHANYFVPGTYRHELRCWPEAAHIVFESLRAPPVDVAGGGRTLCPRVTPVTATRPAWMTYPGAWGETAWFHAGHATFAYGRGPEGPAFHTSWRTPLRELASWPVR